MPLPPSLPLAIVDIDGVVADVRHRLHHLDQRPKDWDGFFADAVNDAVHEEGAAVVHRLEQDHEIIFLTGRPEAWRKDTEQWLRDNGFGNHRVLMRPKGQRLPAAQVKVQALRRLRRDNVIAIVIDDDASVIAAVQQEGIPTLHADWEIRSLDQQQQLFGAQEEDGTA